MLYLIFAFFFTKGKKSKKIKKAKKAKRDRREPIKKPDTPVLGG